VEQLAVTTNGVLLHRHADTLVSNRFRRWNISLDTLDRGKFSLISNKPGSFFDKMRANLTNAIERLESGQLETVKVNTVVMRHVNDDEIGALVELTRDWPIQLRFIELMPFSGNNYSEKFFFSKSEIFAVIAKLYGGIERINKSALESNSSVGNQVWRVPGYRGEVAIISSMTDAFCGSCDRLRLTSDGNVRNCLFSSDAEEASLLSVVRQGGSDDELEYIIRRSVDRKHFAHGGQASVAALASRARPMVAIGG
jgi:cyclic pyranopterin phosphate synthase